MFRVVLSKGLAQVNSFLVPDRECRTPQKTVPSDNTILKPCPNKKKPLEYRLNVAFALI